MTLANHPIAGAVLANADIDHVLGLLLLRELHPLRVHCYRFHPPHSDAKTIPCSPCCSVFLIR